MNEISNVRKEREKENETRYLLSCEEKKMKKKKKSIVDKEKKI
jgi:hypothetical protein